MALAVVLSFADHAIVFLLLGFVVEESHFVSEVVLAFPNMGRIAQFYFYTQTVLLALLQLPEVETTSEVPQHAWEWLLGHEVSLVSIVDGLGVLFDHWAWWHWDIQQ